MVIFLILERVIRQWFTRQVIYSTDDDFPYLRACNSEMIQLSAIHHHQISIIFSHPSSSHIDHRQLSIMFSHPSSSNIDHLQASIIITSSIILSHPSSTVIHHLQPSIFYRNPSSSHIDHLQPSIIITYRSSSSHPSSSNIREMYFLVGCWDFPWGDLVHQYESLVIMG